MAQLKKPLQEVRIPFAKMSYTPDVPSTSLSANEYNSGQNVETDVRGIRSMAGDQQILDSLPAGSGPPTFVTSNFRDDGKFWFVVATAATTGQPGQYFASCDTTTWTDITPTAPTFNSTAYAQNTNITEGWNGNVLFLNDTLNPPLIWLPPLDPAVPTPPPKLTMYSNQVPLEISTIAPQSVSEKVITFTEAQLADPFVVGEYVTVSGVFPDVYNATWLVMACTTTTVTIFCDVTNAYSNGGQVAPEYSWNFEPTYKSVTAGFLRLYNTPSIGTLLLCGDITKVDQNDVPTRFSTLMRWSQGFIDQVGDPVPAPVTWDSYDPAQINNSETPLPIRGPILDAFPCNGQIFVSSYWDTVVISPLNFSTSDTASLGVRPFNQGRGMLSSNCWANTDKLVYGLDARDIWVFDGQDFQGLGNQRVKNWLFDQIDPAYYDQIYMQTNTQRNQIEIYYADKDSLVSSNLAAVAITGTGGQFSCTATNISIGQEIVVSGTLTGTGTITGYTNPKSYYVIATNNTTTFTLSATPSGSAITTTAGTTAGLTFAQVNRGVPNKMLSYRFDLDCFNAPRDVSNATFATEAPVYSYDAISGDYTPLLSSRTVVYAQGVAESKLIQKDQGYSYLDSAPIDSIFRRDNIKLSQDYSTKVMVHRLLPEVVNLGAVANENNEIPLYPSPGQITITVEGANSVGSIASDNGGSIVAVELYVNADGTDNTRSPWAQINQNAFRVVSLSLSNTSATDIWMCNAATWQITEVEDDR
jgi:hypothetical protein